MDIMRSKFNFASLQQVSEHKSSIFLVSIFVSPLPPLFSDDHVCLFGVVPIHLFLFIWVGIPSSNGN